MVEIAFEERATVVHQPGSLEVLLGIATYVMMPDMTP